MSDPASEPDVLAPESAEEICEAIADCKDVLPVGKRTKTPLSAGNYAALMSTRNLSGIVQYEPSEFTITALAGTSLAEIDGVLADRQQYLPFDPPLVDSGATIGGTVAAGLSGPGRFRYGGVRDFLLGVQMVAAGGDIVRAGGKVVKNAAGFDIPKLMVGSVGRLAVLTELTFKVFPKPASELTLYAKIDSHQQALEWISRLARSRYEFDAIDYRPFEGTIYARLRGPEAVNETMAKAIADESPLSVLAVEQADAFWTSLREFEWRSDRVHLKVPVTIEQFLALQSWAESLEIADGAELHLSVAGAVAWIAVHPDAILGLHTQLCKAEIEAIAVRGDCSRWHWGCREHRAMQMRMKSAMDPHGCFPGSFAAVQS